MVKKTEGGDGLSSMYRKTKNTVSYIRYVFVFCPSRKRKIFDIPEVSQRFEEKAEDVCKRDLDTKITDLRFGENYVRMTVCCPPWLSPQAFMRKVKYETSRYLRSIFPELSHRKSLWTKSYFVTTNSIVTEDTLEEYVSMQK